MSGAAARTGVFKKKVDREHTGVKNMEYQRKQ